MRDQAVRTSTFFSLEADAFIHDMMKALRKTSQGPGIAAERSCRHIAANVAQVAGCFDVAVTTLDVFKHIRTE
jgi:hypothetical protein